MKKNIKRVAAAICLSVLFVACGKFFDYILVDDTSSYTRLMMHQMYNTSENIDVLFVGSSHVYRSLNPEITDEVFGKYTFNAGTSGQLMDGSLAIIKEAIVHNEIKEIYLEVYYGCALPEANKDRTQLTSTYIISDYMKPSMRKVQYILNASSKEYWINGFIPARRNWESFFDAEYVRKLIIKKQRDSYKNYEWIKTDAQTEYYVDRGFVASEKVVEQEKYWNSSAYGFIESVESITKDCDWRKSLQKIIELCNEEKIKLTLFVAPMPEWTIVGKGNYDLYSNMIQTIAEKNNISYYDFNYCKQEYFSATDKAIFQDEDHLNKKGAEKFSKLFAEFFTGQIDADDLFYDSLEEKMSYEKPCVYGLAGPQKDNNKKVNHITIISNRDTGMEYRVTVLTENGEYRVLQDFDANKAIELPIEEKGVLTIEWRMIDNPKTVEVINYEY